MHIALLILVTLLLEGCGGGGGGSPSVIPPVVAAVQRPDLLFAYFGVMGDQIRATAAHVNCLFTMAWGEPYWDSPGQRDALNESRIAQIEEAVAAGVTKVILGVDYLIFDSNYKYRGVSDLIPFVERLKAAKLWDYVVALYAIDEPELYGVTDATMNTVNTDLQQFGKPVACIYTPDRKWPGISTVQIAAFDKYGHDFRGDGLLGDMKSKLRPEQRFMFVVGGSNPWRDNVKPVLAAANADPQCIGIVAFLYGEHGANIGIRDNGMLPEYAEVGALIKGASHG